MTINRTLWFESQDELDQLVATLHEAADQAALCSQPNNHQRLRNLADALEHGNAPAGEPRPEGERCKMHAHLDPAAEWSEEARLEHFVNCLSPSDQRARWDAMRHQSDLGLANARQVAQLQAQVQTLLSDKDNLRDYAASLAKGLTVSADDVQVEGESTDLRLRVNDADMCVWVVLPGRRVARLADAGPSVLPAGLSARDRAVIAALLQSAQDENTQALRRTRPVTVHTVGM